MKEKIKFKIRKTNEKDEKWIIKFLRKHWGSEKIVSKKKVYYPKELSSFIAVKDGVPIGLITYHISKRECQITSLFTLIKKKKIGTALVEKVKKVARKKKCKRLWLTTTNDNLDGLRFYQRRNFNIKAVYPDSVTYARKKLKPEIPLIGDYGIPIKDELELEIILK